LLGLLCCACCDILQCLLFICDFGIIYIGTALMIGTAAIIRRGTQFLVHLPTDQYPSLKNSGMADMEKHTASSGIVLLAKLLDDLGLSDTAPWDWLDATLGVFAVNPRFFATTFDVQRRKLFR
jgi:hypothetical protein